MILRNEKTVNNPYPSIATQEHLTIMDLEVSEDKITAHLSDSRNIVVPTA